MAGPINLAAQTKRVEVDNRLSLRFYYRTAANLLKQASVYREENNIIDLYVILMRFSSLVSETIPAHKDYRVSPAKEKVEYRKKAEEVLDELETLKPEVLRQIDLLNRAESLANDSARMDVTAMFPSVPSRNVSAKKEVQRIGLGGRSRDPPSQSRDYWNAATVSTPVDNRFGSLSLHIPRPKDETLSRHSFLTSTVVRRQTPPVTFKPAQYPSYIDATPIEMPSLEQNSRTSTQTAPDLVVWPESDIKPLQLPYAIPVGPDVAPTPKLFIQPSPPPILAPVQTLDTLDHLSAQPGPESVADPRPGPPRPQDLNEELRHGKGTKQLHISSKMMEEFMALSRFNTGKNLETCGVLAGFLKTGVFNVTTLIIPKQEATSDSCQTVNEEEIFEAQDKRGLFQLGWIHTHPSQTCFMSSIDLHTHYSYQIMLQEAIAIVMAPTDTERKFGIFRLSDPGGLNAIQQCQKRGFHPHEEPADGSPIYEHSSHVYMNPNIRFDVIDLRDS